MKIKSGTNLTLTLNVMFFYHDLLFVAMIVIFLWSITTLIVCSELQAYFIRGLLSIGK